MKTLQRYLKRLQANEDGVTMTEFVITLPVFIIIFVGIVELTNVQNAANDAHLLAINHMWWQAHDSMTSDGDSVWADPSIRPPALPDPGPACREQGGERYIDCLKYDDHKYTRLAEYGTLAEAIGAADFDEVRQWWSIAENHQAYSNSNFTEVDLRMYEAVYKGSSTWGDYALRATRDAGADPVTIPMAIDLPNSMPDFESKVGGKGVSPLAWGAGTRYGLARGDVSTSVTTTTGTRSFRVVYETYAPSRPHDSPGQAMKTVGTARLLMEESGYERVLGFEHERRLEGFYEGNLVEGNP